jgi:hypothetical protein
MKIRALVTKSLLISVAFSIVPSQVQSAQKITAGSICKVQKQKVDYLGRTYTCIKSGKKLVWNKGVVVVKPTPVSMPTPTPVTTPTPVSTPTPIPIPTPKFIPWTTDLSQEILISQTNSEFKKWVSEDHGNIVMPNYVVDPKLEGVDISWIKNSLSLATRAFGADSPPTYTVVVGKDCEWIRTNASVPCADSIGNQYFSDSVSKGIFILKQVTDPAKLRPSDFQTSAHEYFHAIQAKLSGGANWPSRTPTWFIEGGAYYVGISFSDASGISTYMRGRDEEVLQRDYQSKKHVPLENYTYQNFIPSVSYENPYGIGCIATEYIVASVGMERYLNIYRSLGLGKDFRSSFETATGMPLVDFYTKFEIIRDKVGMPRGQ